MNRQSAVNSWLITVDQPGTKISDEVLDGNAANQNEARVGGILIRAPGCEIVDCILHNFSGVAIGAAGDARNTLIANNNINDTWMQAIAFFNNEENYGGSRIINNDIRNAQLDTIQIGGLGKVTVEQNDIADCQFAGIYALTGTRNAVIRHNMISNCFGGIDVSWGVINSNRVGTDLTAGISILNNRVDRCAGGIGWATNGAVVIGNIVTDCGADWQQSFTLLGVTSIGIINQGHGYVVGNILPLIGGTQPAGDQPAKVIVRAVDANGGLQQVEVRYVGVYFAFPTNPIPLAGGSGEGATISIPHWNQRNIIPNGIGLTDACDCVVMENISGNTIIPGTQQTGFLMRRIFTAPLRNMITNNNFSRNALAPINGYYANTYSPAILQGNTTSPNQI